MKNCALDDLFGPARGVSQFFPTYDRAPFGGLWSKSLIVLIFHDHPGYSIAHMTHMLLLPSMGFACRCPRRLRWKPFSQRPVWRRRDWTKLHGKHARRVPWKWALPKTVVYPFGLQVRCTDVVAGPPLAGPPRKSAGPTVNLAVPPPWELDDGERQNMWTGPKTGAQRFG